MKKWLLGVTTGCGCVTTIYLLLVFILPAALLVATFQAYVASVYEYLFGDELPDTIHGQPAAGFITAAFADPDYYDRFGVLHTGIDIANSRGTPVYSTVDEARVVKVGYESDGYGVYVKLQDEGNDWYVLYAHLRGVAPGIHTGATVEWGDVVGYMDSSGNSTGDHVHYEIRRPDNAQVNPDKSKGCC